MNVHIGKSIDTHTLNRNTDKEGEPKLKDRPIVDKDKDVSWIISLTAYCL